MWQIYLYLANERQLHEHHEHHEDMKRRVESESRIRRWLHPRRSTETQPVTTQAR
jgi:hypothetical protein